MGQVQSSRRRQLGYGDRPDPSRYGPSPRSIAIAAGRHLGAYGWAIRPGARNPVARGNLRVSALPTIAKVTRAPCLIPGDVNSAPCPFSARHRPNRATCDVNPGNISNTDVIGHPDSNNYGDCSDIALLLCCDSRYWPHLRQTKKDIHLD